jgi:predicted Zn-dependent protease
MTCRHSLVLALAALLAGCGAGDGRSETGGDWRAMLARGDGVGAEIALDDALARGGHREELAPFLGEAALLEGNLGEARKWLANGRFAPGVAPHGFRMLGRLRMQEGDLPAAGKAFDRALAGAPKDPALWVDIARLRWRGGEQRQAIEASEKALRLGPDNPDALLLRAQLVRDARGNDAALPLLEHGLAAKSDDADLLAEYAATLGESGRAKNMLAATRRLAAAAPTDKRALYLQAVLAARSGQDGLARSLLQRTGDNDRAMPAATLLLAVLDLENGNAASAAQGLDRLLRRQPDNARVAALLARALAIGGNDRELVARFAARADTPYLAALVGRSYEALGERDKAAPYLDRAARGIPGDGVRTLPPAFATDLATPLDPADGTALVSLVRAQIAANRAGDARAATQAFRARYPGSADATALAGDAALAAGDAAGALALYREAAAIRRPWPLVRRMAVALRRTGDARGASALLAAEQASQPANAEASTVH